MKPRLWRAAAGLGALTVMALALTSLHRELQHVHYRDIAAAMKAIPPGLLLLALFLTAANRHGEYFYNFQDLRACKEKFRPRWRPKYLASPGGLALPLVLTNLASLISGGLLGAVVAKTGFRA